MTPLEKEVMEIITQNSEGDIKKYIENLLEYGCESGMVGGLIYYNEISLFYEKHKEEIWDIVIDYTEEMGYENPFEFLATLRGADNVKGVYQFETLLVWFAVEEIARMMLEKDEIN